MSSLGYNFTSTNSLKILNELCVVLQRICFSVNKEIKFELIGVNRKDNEKTSKWSHRRIPAYSFDFKSSNKLEISNKMIDVAKSMNVSIRYIDLDLNIGRIEMIWDKIR